MALYPAILHRLDVVMSWTLYEFSLPCYPPFETRKGMILKIKHPDGTTGWGEISPLPERNKETLSQAKQQVLEALEGRKNILYPSVALGLEMAHQSISPINKTLPLCALLTGDPKQILKKAESVYAQGYRTVKLKVSHLSFSDARAVLSLLSPQFQVRVDVNRAWSFDQACAFFSQFDPNAFEFIEEPTYELDKLSKFTHPFALDESLISLSSSDLTTFPMLQALIVKPTLIGNQQECAYYHTLAQKLKLSCVLSSAFESGLGILQICKLSQALGMEHVPLGLDTYRFLKEDLLTTALDFSKPYLKVDEPIALNPTHLKQIAHG